MSKWKIIYFVILIELSWQLAVLAYVRPLISIDYSRYPIFTSNLTRSNFRADRTNFNWNDIFLENDKNDEKNPPKVDLGNGAPNYLPAQSMLNAFSEVGANSYHPEDYVVHQYTRAMGYPRLTQIVGKFFSYLTKRDLNPLTEIMITAGSINSLELFGKAFINPGDEMIVLEPFFFLYRIPFKPFGVKFVPVPLRIMPGRSGQDVADWTFDHAEFESKINWKTKFIMVNNPNNPMGKVYSMEELTFMADMAKKYDLLVVADEAAQVYQYDGPGHIRIATFPGMFERTLTLTSGGKLFSNTGWRIGWVIAPEPLLWGMASLSIVGAASVPMQIAYAIGLENELKKWGTPELYFNQIKLFAKNSRNRLVGILRSVGADVINPSAGYCVVANFTKLMDQVDLSNQTDPRPGFRLRNFMRFDYGIGTYPMTIFYDEKNLWKSEYSLRFTNLKTPQTFDLFEQLLTKIFRKVN